MQPGATHLWDGFEPQLIGLVSAWIGNFAPSPAPDAPATVFEYYNSELDHYFITWMPDEIAILDGATRIRGWMRTGYSFRTYATPQAGASPVCRYYIPPGLGDSHFFGRGTAECNATGRTNPTFVLEDPAFMRMDLPADGICPAETLPVYRVFSNRPDANHRYMIEKAVRSQMVAMGWLAEGDGADLVVMCAPR
jgi:serine protease